VAALDVSVYAFAAVRAVVPILLAKISAEDSVAAESESAYLWAAVKVAALDESV
jgi:hypothetical protein